MNLGRSDADWSISTRLHWNQFPWNSLRIALDSIGVESDFVGLLLMLQQ
ncbi:hypothetical protein SynROS8604_02478 [Synechococcus sp. ROS8604]|nr:hypothetical protein SynROS8604_02478 [Synechococcus sp. ROS8604]